MISIGYNNIVKQALSSYGIDTTETYTPGPFKHRVINLTKEDLAYRQEVRERAELMKENGERWTANSLFKTDLSSPKGYTVNEDALNKVRDKLKEEGIDADSRTPTHEITDEQMEQLAEKYDLEYLSIAGMEDTEYGNFMLDLAYMNVFSLDEMEEMFGVCEFNSNHRAHCYCMPADGSTPYYMGDDGSRYYSWEDMLKSVNEEYLRINYPGRSGKEYREMVEDFISRREERMSVIRDFFARASKYYDYGLIDVVKPMIEDASARLLEDFSGKM